MLEVKERKRIFETLNIMLQLNNTEAKQYVQELMLAWTYSVFLTDKRVIASNKLYHTAHECILCWRWTLVLAGDERVGNTRSNFSHTRTISYQRLPNKTYPRDDCYSSPQTGVIMLWKKNKNCIYYYIELCLQMRAREHAANRPKSMTINS